MTVQLKEYVMVNSHARWVACVMFTHPEGVPAKPFLERRLKFNLQSPCFLRA